jgi:serine/threonine-protein kinase
MTGAVMDGRYRLLAQLGAGGEARVYRARDESTGQDVAVRVALQHDFKCLAAIPDFSHAHWVRLFSTGFDDALGAYQVFELLEGRTLAESVRDGPLTRDAWCEFVEHALDAVQGLHDLGLVHADLNADNFLHTRDGWKMLELPFHRFITTSARSHAFGSIYTLAPEQIDGSAATVLSDIYSLGCLFYYAASGRWPHDGRNAQEVAISCLLHAAPELRDLAPQLRAGECNAVMRLIETRAGNRPATIAEARQPLVTKVA